jgi:putative ABC transport system permease protein
MTFASNITNFNVYVKDGTSTSDVETSLRQELDRIYNEADNAFSVINLEALVNVMGSVQSMLTSMLGGIASIALLVGGIGIMNMMLTSVSERTREIGLRKALGAQPSRIQVQFLMESIILSLMGGFIGIILGLIIAYVGSNLMDVAFKISWGAVALGVGFSAAVGIIFGWMPARRASELNPIDALRSE